MCWRSGRKTAVIGALIAVSSLTPLVGCSEGEQWKSPVTVIETGYWQSPTSGRRAIWKNNNEVYFLTVGSDSRSGFTGNEGGALYSYDVSSGRSLHIDNAQTLYCIHDQRISYIAASYADSNGEWHKVRKEGLLGHEKVIEGVRVGKWKYDWKHNGSSWNPPEGNTFNEYVCDYCLAPSSDLERRIIRSIHPKHGYLDYGEKGFKNGSNQLTIFVRASDGARFKMPFTLETTNDRIDYYPINNRYLLWVSAKEVIGRQGWAGYAFLPAWWLSPDGEVENIYIPAEPWSKWGVSTLRYTARGYLIHSNAMKRGGLVGDSGLYITDLTPNKYTKLVAGVITEVEVSPDGCRVFFSEIPRIGDRLADSLVEKIVPYPSVPRWKLIDLCRDLP